MSADTPVHAERAHSLLGASSCSRWWNCPGSVHLGKQFPSRSSAFAKEGTAAHELSQKCLESDDDAYRYLGQFIDGIEVTEEMVEAVQVYVDTCREAAATATMPPMIETRITLERLNPPDNMFGTADYMVVQGDTLCVIDLKYGKGIAVGAEGNPQLKYYALGALYALPDNIGIKRIKVMIVQPRAAGPAIKPAEYDIIELLEWSVELIDRARAALEPNAEVNPGSWCRFCPATGVCPAQADKALKAAQNAFTVEDGYSSELELPQLSILTPVQMSILLRNASTIKTWITAIEDAAKTLVEMDPNAVPGWGLEPSKGTRQWIGEDSAAAKLKEVGLPEDAIYKKEIISPAQAEEALARATRDKYKTLKEAKAVAKEALAKSIHTISASTKLVPVAETAPALPAQRTNLFT